MKVPKHLRHISQWHQNVRHSPTQTKKESMA